MFQACLDRGEVKQAIGIALEARRVDVLQEAVKRAADKKQILEYCLEVCMSVIQSREFRNTVSVVCVCVCGEGKGGGGGVVCFVGNGNPHQRGCVCIRVCKLRN